MDRDILTTLEAPLGHLLRNAIDHGIESPDERRAAGKPAEGTIRLEARHSAGMLQIIVVRRWRRRRRGEAAREQSSREA